MAHNNTSEMKDLENIGWGQMSRILDKEMPIRKQKNREFIWWLSGAAAATLTLVMGLSIFNSAKDLSTLVGQIESPISQDMIIEETAPIIDTETTLITPPQEVYSNHKPTQTINDPITQSIEPQLPIEQNKRVAQRNTTFATSYQKTEFINNDTIKSGSISKKMNKETKKEIHLDLNQDYVMEKYEYINISPSISTVALSNHSNHKQIPNKEIIKNNKLRYGVSLSHAHSQYYNYNEAGIGVTGKLAINKRWSLVSGVTFQKRNRLFNHKNKNNHISADAIGTGQNSSAGVIADQHYGESANIKFRQISLQFGAQYNLTPRWAFNSSIIPSYAIVNADAYNEASANAFSLSANEISPKKWNAHVDVGINYALTEDIGIGLNYSYLATKKGQTSLTSPNFESEEWRLSVHYLLD